ncbi:MAG: phosphate acetyltransferase [Rhodobacteraceae bacterium]|nr:phosphate acetyltransferase [Paracoccaceae bacterium]
MKVGQGASVTRSFSAGDLADFAALSGGPVGDQVPEPLIGALFSFLLGVECPGCGTNYLKQDMVFHAPAPLDTPLTASVEITRLRLDKALADLWARCTLADGTVICEGRALVSVRDVQTADPSSAPS